MNKYTSSNYWINLVKIEERNNPKLLKQLIDFMQNKKIEIRPVWHPNHMQKPYIKCQRYKIEKSEEIVRETICLPSGAKIKSNQIKHVVEKLESFF